MIVEAKLLITDSNDDPVPDLPLMLTVEDATFINTPPATTDSDGYLKVKFSTTALGEYTLKVLTPEGELLGTVIIPVSVGLTVKNSSAPQPIDISKFSYSVEACLTDDGGPVSGKVDVSLPTESQAQLASSSPATLDNKGCTNIQIETTKDAPLTISVIPSGLSSQLTALVSPPHNPLHAEIFDDMSPEVIYTIWNPRIGLFAINPNNFFNYTLPMSQIIMGEVSSAALPNPIGHSKVMLDLPNLVDQQTIYNIQNIGNMALHFLIAYDDLDMNGTWDPDSEPLLGVQGTDMFLFTKDGWSVLEYTENDTNGGGQYISPDIITSSFTVLIRNAHVNEATFHVILDKNDLNDVLPSSELHNGKTGIKLYLVPPYVLINSELDVDSNDTQLSTIIDTILNDGILVGDATLEIVDGNDTCFAFVPLTNTYELQNNNEIDSFLMSTESDVTFNVAVGMAFLYHEDSNGNLDHWLLMDQHIGRSLIPFVYVHEVDPVFPTFITMNYMQKGIAGEQPDPSPHTYLHTGWTATDIAIERQVNDVHIYNKLLELDKAISCGTSPDAGAWFGMEIDPNTRIYGKVSCPDSSDIDWSKHNSATLLNYRVIECWHKDSSDKWVLDATSNSNCQPTQNASIKIFDFHPMDKFMMFFKWDNQMFEAWPVSQYTVGTVIN